MATNATVAEDVPDRLSPGDWSSSYSQFLSRATAQAAATMGLCQQALLRVSQGKLEPTAFQNYFPLFVQTHGAEYAARLSELTGRFLSQLVEISAAFSRNGMESATPGFAESDLTPPRFEAGDAVRWFEQLAEYAGKLNNRALKAYRAQLDRIASGEKSPAEVQQNTYDYLSSKAPRLLEQLARLYFELLNGLNEVRARYEREYFLGVLALGEQPEREPPVVLPVRGPRGETAAASLSVTNTTGEKSKLRFTYTDARRVDGIGPAFTPEISIAPSDPELQPGEEQKIRLSVRLRQDQFDEGVTYASTLYITGSDVRRVEVDLRIVATEATHSARSALAEG